MDLSDGSDVEECIDDVDQDAENVLLGSDDEEFTRNITGSHGLGEDNEDKVLETDEEEEDVLELALDADEELDEFVEKQQPNCNRVAPVKVRIQENAEKSIHSSCSESRSQSTSDNPHSTGHEEEDDTESDPKNTRSRFLTERKTEDMNSGSASIGNPIQILGERKVRNPDLRQPKNWGNQRPQPSRQFNRGPRGPLNRQSLLGDAPRHQGFRPRFPNANEAPIVQFQERIFTDFNQPIPQTQQQISNNRLAAPMHNAPVGKPQNPTQGSPVRNNHNNQPGNRHRPFNPNGPFMDPSNRGPQPRGQNLEPRQRHPHDQQWKNRQPGGGVPPAVSGVHPAVIISGNVGPPPFQGPNPGQRNNQHMSPPNQGPPPHLMPHGPGPNNVNLGPPPQHGQMRPGQNMGGHHHNMKRPPKGANNMQGPGNNHNQRGPPNIPNLRGHPPHGPAIQNQIPNHQGPPIGPNMHGHPQGPHQGQNMHIIPQEPPLNVPQGGPPNINHHGPPQGHGPGPHGMVRPINNNIHPGPPGVPPSHPPNQNFGPPPNNLAHGHQVRPPFEGPPGVNNPGHMQHQKPPFHMEQHHGHPNDRPEMNFGHPPRHPNPQMNPRPPFVNHHPRFGSPPRHPGPQPLEMGQNGPFFHQQPGPPMQREHEHPPPPQFWNGPQGPPGPPGHQDPQTWNQNPQLAEHLPRNVGVQQVANMEMEFRHGGPPMDQYQGPSHVPVNEPSSSQYEPHQYQNYASEAPIYNDGSQGRPAYEQQQHLNYYQQGSDQVHFDQFGREVINPGPHLSMVVNGHNDDRYESEKGITRTIVLSNVHEQYLSYPQESERSNDYYQSDRRSVKRKSESNYEYHSPGKTLNSRLGPPVRISDEQHEQAVNIILQTKKEMGIDDEYDKKMEEQKLLRAAILKKKEERRKLTKGGQDYVLDESERDNDRGSTRSRSKYSSRSLTTERSEPPVRNSIYVNPKAFKGNLSLLNSNLKKINMNATSKSKETAVQKEKAPSTKPKTVLRIVRNKRGKIISQSKVKILPNEYQDGPSSSKTS